SKIAEKHGIVQSTLTRTWRGETRLHKEKVLAQQKLTLQQEEELVRYIEELTARHIPPTREMIANFASAVAQEPVSESWVTCFINKYSIHLISQYLTGIDANRHNADSYTKYKLYFNLLQRKIAEYKINAEHTYNIDKKGFIIRVTLRIKHVFSRCIKYHLLIIDSHRSYVIIDSIKYCDQNRILLAILPPYSTHTLQLLNKGLLVIKKSDFFHLFWKAWTNTFTPELILRSFKATDISPLQPTPEHQSFDFWSTPEASDSSTSSSSVYSGKDWLKIETLLRKVVKEEKEETSQELRKISRSLHYILIQNQLLHHKNQEEHRKAEKKKVRQANKLYNERIAQERREQRAREKDECEQVGAKKAKEAAERKAQRERDKQACNAEKTVQLPQRGKRKASAAPAAKISKKRRTVGAARGVDAAEPPAAPRTHTTRSGRTATLYN
ncbi:uncharacterized protein M421DRAFT_426783, partial [Didymella exigua CBS 183.55]